MWELAETAATFHLRSPSVTADEGIELTMIDP
jgi:hypothetical protein